MKRKPPYDFSNQLAANAALNSQIQLLRSRVEAELELPAVILVTSAQRDDGNSLTAHSLAGCFKNCGHRTVLVGQSSGYVKRARGTKFLDRRTYADPAIVELPHDEGVPISIEGLSDFIGSMRADYDVTVIDAGMFLSSTPAMTLAQLVDGILVTVRIGRAPTNEDKLMIRMIEHARGRIIGIVATDGQIVAEFDRMQSEQESAFEAPALNPGSNQPHTTIARSLRTNS